MVCLKGKYTIFLGGRAKKLRIKKIIGLLLVALSVTSGVAFGVAGGAYVPVQDSIARVKKDSLSGVKDSLSGIKDSLRVAMDSLDSLGVRRVALDSVLRDSNGVVLDSTVVDSAALDTIRPPKKPFLDDKIVGKNKDSLVYDVKNKLVYIFREGDVTYQDNNIKADYLRIGTETKNVHAEGLVVDTVTKKLTRPVFKQGTSEFVVDSMDYNMTSGKALIKGVDTKEGEGKIFGGTVKKMKDNTTHMHQGRYTVCDAECPHFYLQMTKGTVVPNKQTVFGASYMVFEDVPIYFLGVPFGFFPQKKERNSGIIIPEIGEEYVKGFFVRNGGYYFAINDYVDLRLVAGIYTLGSWQVGAASNYAWKYKFRGNVGFDYASDKIGERNSPDYIDTKNISIRWSHSQDPKFMPGSTFSASVNYTSSTYNKYNAQNMEDYLNSQTSSTINYSKNWAGKPFALTVNGSMSQNSRDSTITISLPTIAFNVTRIAPFKRKNPIGKERWYEKISFTYNLEMRNEASSIKEADFFKQAMFDRMRFGVKHTLPISASFNVLQYLNISPSISYNERWYFRKINKNWDEEKGAIVADTSRGFYRVYDYSASLGFNTKLYGTYTVGKKKPAIFRHVFTPTISGGFSPDHGARYWTTVQRNAQGELEDYNPYAQELYGTPNRGNSASLSFGLNNSLEAKFYSEKDSTGFKKIKLIDQFNISGGYNFLADSLNLSPFSVTLSTNIVNKIPISFAAAFDPYALDANGRRINKFLVNDGGFLRMTSLAFSFGYSWQGGGKQNSGQPAANNQFNNNNLLQQAQQTATENFFAQQEVQKPTPKELAMFAATQYYDFQIPWSFGFNYSFQYTNTTGKPQINQTINFNGNLNITSKWAVSASAGYDFALGKLTPGTIRITRDLHCWQMSFQWVPVGFRQSWSFNIAVKSSQLSDLLKWEKNNSFYDNYYYNR